MEYVEMAWGRSWGREECREHRGCGSGEVSGATANPHVSVMRGSHTQMQPKEVVLKIRGNLLTNLIDEVFIYN